MWELAHFCQAKIIGVQYCIVMIMGFSMTIIIGE